MNWMTGGADVATMATGVSAVTAAATWTAGRWRAWRREKAAIAERNWHGYIPVNGIDGWDVRLAEDPDTPRRDRSPRPQCRESGTQPEAGDPPGRQAQQGADRRGVGFPQALAQEIRLR